MENYKNKKSISFAPQNKELEYESSNTTSRTVDATPSCQEGEGVSCTESEITSTSGGGGSGENDGSGDEASFEEYHTSVINGIVLEYLDQLGLAETYKTFCKESVKNGIPLPTLQPDPRFQNARFTEKDVENFFVHFDNMDGEELLQLWSRFSEEIENKDTIRRAWILLRIYIASLPFRKNEEEAYKVNALDELREFHQAYGDEFAKDAVCLPLFAFPFVNDPAINPAYSAIFTEEWKKDLRQELEQVFDIHVESDQNELCDLKQLYHHYVSCDNSSIDDNQTTSQSVASFQDDFPTFESRDAGTQSIDNINQFHSQVSNFFKRNLIHTQNRYCKLLSATSAIVSALESAVQGKAQDIKVLQLQLKVSFPELFNPLSLDLDTRISSTPKSVYNHTQHLENTPPPLPLLEELLNTARRSRTPIAAAGAASSVKSCSSKVSHSYGSGRRKKKSTGRKSIQKCTKTNSTTSESERDERDEINRREILNTAGFSTVGSNYSAPGTRCGCDSGSLTGSPLSSVRSLRRKKQTFKKPNSKPPSTPILAASVMKLTDSKANTKIIQDPEEWAANEDSDIPEEFCQYFTNMHPSPRNVKFKHETQHQYHQEQQMQNFEENSSSVNAKQMENNSLLPPSVSDPFPPPPRTYEVSPRSSKVVFIPAHLNSVRPSKTFGSGPGSSGTGDRQMSETRITTTKQAPKFLRSAKGSRSKLEVPERDKLKLIPEPHQVLGRILTPPPDRKVTKMASLMGVIENSSGHEHGSTTGLLPRRGAGHTFKSSKLKRLKNPIHESCRPAQTQPILTRPSPVLGIRKEFNTDGQFQQRIYKISPQAKVTSNQGIFTIKSIVSPQQGQSLPHINTGNNNTESNNNSANESK